MKMGEKPSIGTGMPSWAERAKEINPALARELGEPRQVGWDNLEKFNLPRQKHFLLPLQEFLRNPEKYFSALGCERFFVYLSPLGAGEPARKKGIKRDAALRFIRSCVAPEKYKNYRINIAEWYKNEYGGNIIVDNAGVVRAEFRKGDQGPISAGTATPELFVEGNPFTGVLRYSFSDLSLRKSMHAIIKSIPHDEKHYMPGFYEFQLVRKTKDGLLKPFFVDARTGTPYRK